MGHQRTKTIFSVVVTELSTVPNNLVCSHVENVSLLWVGSLVTLISCAADGNGEAVDSDEILKEKKDQT